MAKATLYKNLVSSYLNGDEIPIAVYEGVTITLRDSWSDAYGIYDAEGNKVARKSFWWDACCEAVRAVHHLEKFPYDSRFDIPTNPYYDEAVRLQLHNGGDNLAEIIRDEANLQRS